MSETAAAQPLVSVSVARDGVALIHLNRPPANSYNRAFLDDLNAAVDRVRWDGDIGGAVLVSDLAPRFFSAGADISNFKNSTQQQRVMTVLHAQEILLKIERTPKIVVAAIGGHALGGGFEIALACPIVLASQRSRFGLPEARLGVMPGYGGTQRLRRAVGHAPAMALMLTGKPIDADRAWHLGLLSAPPEAPADLPAVAMALATDLAGLSRPTSGLILEAARTGGGPEGLRHEATLAALAIASRDGREGIRSFQEKRPPEFRRG
jgi:enoyl-CoA hydratase